MNPFSKRIHQIKNLDLDLPKGTRNPYLDLKSVFGFTERNTPLISKTGETSVTRSTFNILSHGTELKHITVSGLKKNVSV